MNGLVSKEKEPLIFLLRKAESCILDGNEEKAKAYLDEARKSSILSSQQWMVSALLNEMLGRPKEALEDYAKALTLDPTLKTARIKRARLLLERGDTTSAKEELKHAFIAGAKETEARKELGPLLIPLVDPTEPSDSEIDEAFYQSRGRRQAIERFLLLFRGRPGAYARQWFNKKDGRYGYFPVLEPLTPQVVEAHLEGKVTLGVYLLTPREEVYFAALDMDVGKDAIASIRKDPILARQMGSAMRGLMSKVHQVSQQWGLSVVFEKSGYKGVHAWYFFEDAVPAWAAKEIMEALKDAVSPPPIGINLEVFPKQAQLTGKGYGNLIKLPLGVHRVTGRRSEFLGPDGIPVEDSLKYVLKINTNPLAHVMSLAEKFASTKKGRLVYLRNTFQPRNESERPFVAERPNVQVNDHVKNAYARILERCSMIRYLVKKARDYKHLTFDERKIILGVLGHLPGGEALVHHVISRCSDYDPQITGHFISRLPKAPLGCRSIRRRLFYLEQTQCKCTFLVTGKDYPNPLLHLDPDNRKCSSA